MLCTQIYLQKKKKKESKTAPHKTPSLTGKKNTKYEGVERKIVGGSGMIHDEENATKYMFIVTP